MEEETQTKEQWVTEKPLEIAVGSEEPQEAQEEPWKPGKVVLYVCVGLFLVIAVADKILLDYVFEDGATPFVLALVYFFDACGRLALTGFLINWEKTFAKMDMYNIPWVIFCRFGLQVGFLMGGISIKYIKAGTLSMMIQSQLLITGIFRYFIFKETLSYNQMTYAVAVAIGAFAFKSNIIDEGNTGAGWEFGFGMILCGFSCIVVSLFFVLTEKLLKNILQPFSGWDKQFLFALVDIPVMIIVAYLNIIWDIYGCGMKERSWNMFAGATWLCVGTSINCVGFGVLLYFMFDWIDSIMVNIFFVIAMALTWPLELILGFEKFFFSRLLILIFTVICCMGYQLESISKRNNKALIESLKAEALAPP